MMARGVSILGAVAFSFFAICVAAFAQPIDRNALVTRHNPVLRSFDVESPLSVGNGQFAFTADVTGLQTFPEAFEKTIPLGTLSHWGWHSAPNPRGWSIEKYEFTEFDSHGRKVGYADIPGNRPTSEVEWLRRNPHRLHLGRIGFRLTKADGTPAAASDLTDIEQTLDLWSGVLVSRFKLEGQPVEVETVCHPTLDLVAVRVTSPLVATKRLAIEVAISVRHGRYGDGRLDEAGRPHLENDAGWRERRSLRTSTRQRYVRSGCAVDTGGVLSEVAPHDFVLTSAGDAPTLEFICQFAPKQAAQELPNFATARAAATAQWNNFWSTGGAIDLSRSRDPRWKELERRIVLSQYLTAIQCSGEFPPAETGLTYNSWYGKFHLEMHWWHAVHFALVGSAADVGTQPRLLLGDSSSRAGSGQAARLSRRPLAEDDGPERVRVAVDGGAVSRLAAAASDLLRGAVLPGPSGSGDAGKVQGRGL